MRDLLVLLECQDHLKSIRVWHLLAIRWEHMEKFFFLIIHVEWLQK